MKKRKLAVILPGLGYHCDKPLLYYTKKYLKTKSYDIEEITYHDLPQWKKDSLPQIGKIVVQQACEAFEKISVKDYNEIVFVSKSIGSVAACYLSQTVDIDWKHICFTPVDLTIPLLETGHMTIFSGTDDPLVDGSHLERVCKEKKIPLHRIKHGNHSLETGDVLYDIRQLKDIITIVNKIENL